MRPALILALAALALACAKETSVPILRLPGTGTETVVTQVVARAGYLDAMLGDMRFFFPDDEACRTVLSEGADVWYIETGTLGRVQRGEVHCDPVGVGSLEEWRSRQPRYICQPGVL